LLRRTGERRRPDLGDRERTGFERHRNGSARAAQARQSDLDEPVDRGLGRQAAGGREGVEAVARKLLRRDIIPDLAGPCALDQQVSNQVPKLLLRLGDVFTAMQERCELGVVALAGNERKGLEHRFETLARAASSVSDFGEMLEVTGDMPFVPRDQDRFDVWEVLVQRRTSDAGLLGNPRHRYRCQPVLGHQRRGGVQGRIAHGAAVRLDRLVP
jgi:hypothetical protein